MKGLTKIYSISEGVTPEKKDLDRINSIMAKANGSEQKAIQLNQLNLLKLLKTYTTPTTSKRIEYAGLTIY